MGHADSLNNRMDRIAFGCVLCQGEMGGGGGDKNTEMERRSEISR